jgi:uncharacterized protein YjiS (DUF1127 family)
MSQATTGPFAGQSGAHPLDSRAASQLMVLGYLANAVLHAPSSVLAWIAERRRIKLGVAALEELSDHMLADIGVQRSEIRRVARYGRNAVERSG